MRELIYKRGYGKLNQQRTALTDNAIVEQNCNSKIALFREGRVCFNLLLICYNVVTGSGEVWHYLYGRSHPWDNDSWSSLQAGKQLPVAILVEGNFGWSKEEEKPLRWGRRCRKLREWIRLMNYFVSWRIEVFIVPGSGSNLNTNMLMVSTLVFGFEFQKILLPSQIVFTIYEYSAVLMCSLDFIITCSMWFYLLVCQIFCLLQDLSSFRNIHGHNFCCLACFVDDIFFSSKFIWQKHSRIHYANLHSFSKEKDTPFFNFYHRIVCHVSLVHVFLSNLLASENP